MLLRGRQLEILTSARPGFFPDSASCELPLLTPCSKAVMSQALKATFSGFKKEQRRLGIPKSKCLRRAAERGLRRAGRASLAALARDGCILSPCVRRLPKSGRDGGKLSQLLFQPHQLDTVARVLEFTWGVSLRLLVFGARVEVVGKSGAISLVSPPPSISPCALRLPPRRPLAVDGAAGVPVAALGHQRVQPGEREPAEVRHERPDAVQPGQGAFPGAGARLRGRHSLGASGADDQRCPRGRGGRTTEGQSF